MITQEQARDIIKSYKTNYGVTYKSIAAELNISQGHLSLFLDGKRNFKRDTLYKLERYLKGGQL